MRAEPVTCQCERTGPPASLSSVVTLFTDASIMKAPLFKINSLGLLLCMLCSARQAGAQFVDLRAQIEFYDWSTAPGKIVNIHCVIGTNRWEMDGDFCANCDQTYWFTGKRII